MKIDDCIIQAVKTGVMSQPQAVTVLAAVLHIGYMLLAYPDDPLTVMFKTRFGTGCAEGIIRLTEQE